MPARIRQDENLLSSRREQAIPGQRKDVLNLKSSTSSTLVKPSIRDSKGLTKSLGTKSNGLAAQRTALASLTNNTPQPNRILQPSKTAQKSINLKSTKLDPSQTPSGTRLIPPKSTKRTLSVYTPARPVALEKIIRKPESDDELEYTAPTAIDQPYQPSSPQSRYREDDLSFDMAHAQPDVAFEMEPANPDFIAESTGTNSPPRFAQNTLSDADFGEAAGYDAFFLDI